VIGENDCGSGGDEDMQVKGPKWRIKSVGVKIITALGKPLIMSRGIDSVPSTNLRGLDSSPLILRQQSLQLNENRFLQRKTIPSEQHRSSHCSPHHSLPHHTEASSLGYQ